MKKYLTFCLFLLPLFSFAQEIGVGFSAGIGRRGIIRSKDYVLRSTISANIFYKPSPVWDLKLEYDNIYTDRPEENLLYAWGANKWATGILIMGEYRIGKMYFGGGFGKYLDFVSVWNQNFPNDKIFFYNKLGIKYEIKKNILIGVYMRSHRAQADYLDFSISYKIPGIIKWKK